jgi:hypothetical protein
MKYLLVYFLLFGCKTQIVQGVNQKVNPLSHILLGNIENRDIKYHPHIHENFRDMIKYDLLEYGYSVEKIDTNFGLKKEENLNESIGGLPLVLRKSAGESLSIGNKLQYSKKEIQELSKFHQFDYFIQGALAIHTNGKILESIDHNLFFLDIYRNDGSQVGMVRFTLDEKSVYEANLIKQLSNQIVSTINTKLKERKK